MAKTFLNSQSDLEEAIKSADIPLDTSTNIQTNDTIDEK